MSYLLWQEISSCLIEMDQEQLLLKKSGHVSDLNEGIRKKFSDLFEQLRLNLEKNLEKHHVSLMIFALVVAIDEEMQSIDYTQSKLRWQPLQVQFFSAHTGGEVFFKVIDEHLDDLTIPSIVYEVFYFMIKRGFQGKHRNSKLNLEKYLELLKARIKITAPVIQQDAADTAIVNKGIKPWYYYGCAIALILVVGFSLVLFSNINIG